MPCSVANTFVDENGLLFLPAAGLSVGAVVSYAGTGGYYNHRSAFSSTYSFYVQFGVAAFNPALSNNRERCYSVRLVCLAQ